VSLVSLSFSISFQIELSLIDMFFWFKKSALFFVYLKFSARSREAIFLEVLLADCV